MMKSLTLTLCALLLAIAPTLALGDQVQVRGTVSKIAESSITVATMSGETKTVNIVAATKFIKSGAPATLKDLQEGDRAVIEATTVGENLEASEVRFNQSAKATPRH
jgi:protein involved in polysaccharide export with SLBB domain